MPLGLWVEEGSTIPLRPALRSTAFGGRLSSAGPWTPLHVGMVGGQWTLSGLWGRGGRNIPETMAHQRSGRRESRAKRWASAQSRER